ncbi:hypothetical protein L3X38_011056 [Prunus dulcis]|uniref:Uncharacterized protein n=1 Tax=Prunus dulcis TaxID=3755 RepID=A0AAD4ZEN5_PRUDU|nr:hypothetical protein L3X38_011056 [Prunus dulcis]
MYDVNQAAGAVCGGRSRVEKIWRVESGEGENFRLLTVLVVGFPVRMSLRFLLDHGCPTCINTGLLFTFGSKVVVPHELQIHGQRLEALDEDGRELTRPSCAKGLELVGVGLEGRA